MLDGLPDGFGWYKVRIHNLYTVLRRCNGCCIGVTDRTGSLPWCTVYYCYFFRYTVGQLRYVRKVNWSTDVLFSLLVPHSEENALQITYCISFDAHVHIVPLPYFRPPGDVIVGDVHTTGISYFPVNYYNLPVVAVHGMIDPRECNRVEFHNFNTSVTDCFQMVLL